MLSCRIRDPLRRAMEIKIKLSLSDGQELERVSQTQTQSRMMLFTPSDATSVESSLSISIEGKREKSLTKATNRQSADASISLCRTNLKGKSSLPNQITSVPHTVMYVAQLNSGQTTCGRYTWAA